MREVMCRMDSYMQSVIMMLCLKNKAPGMWLVKPAVVQSAGMIH